MSINFLEILIFLFLLINIGFLNLIFNYNNFILLLISLIIIYYWYLFLLIFCSYFKKVKWNKRSIHGAHDLKILVRI